MTKLWVPVLAVCSALATPVTAQTPASPTRTPVNYDAQIRPILAQHCYGCHGPEAQQSGLRLDLRQPAMRRRLRAGYYTGQQRGQQANQAHHQWRRRPADAPDWTAVRG